MIFFLLTEFLFFPNLVPISLLDFLGQAYIKYFINICLYTFRMSLFCFVSNAWNNKFKVANVNVDTVWRQSRMPLDEKENKIRRDKWVHQYWLYV